MIKLSEDEKLIKIKELTKTIVPDCRIMLFGSRARGDYSKGSDYDIMIIIPYEIEVKEKMRLATRLNKLLVKNDIISDIIIESEEEIEMKKEFIGNVVRYAVREGVFI